MIFMAFHILSSAFNLFSINNIFPLLLCYLCFYFFVFFRRREEKINFSAKINSNSLININYPRNFSFLSEMDKSNECISLICMSFKMLDKQFFLTEIFSYHFLLHFFIGKNIN